MSGARLREIYRRLHDCHGHQHWWPGETPFEIMIGAILTQNTAWANVEKAIANLEDADCLDPCRIRALETDRLATLIRPSGYFNIKARRLQNFCRWYLEQGGLEGLGRLPDQELRQALLAVNGIGPETADDILLYAFERPVFVIDAYTRRLFSRLGLVDHDAGYEELRSWFEGQLGRDTRLYNDYHAQIVIHAKDVCRKTPRCGACCLRGSCALPLSEPPLRGISSSG